MRARRRDLLLRARAYAEAALRDFRHYQGRAADLEAALCGCKDRPWTSTGQFARLRPARGDLAPLCERCLSAARRGSRKDAEAQSWR